MVESPEGFMTSPLRDFSTIRVSTEHLPAHRQIPLFREEVGRSLLRLDVTPMADRPFRAEATLRSLPRLRLCVIKSSGVQLQRTYEIIKDGNDDLGLVLSLKGRIVAFQRGREVPLGAGASVPIASAETAGLMLSHASFLGLAVPLSVLVPLVPDIEDKWIRPLPRELEPVRLLRSYLAALMKEGAVTTPELAALAATHVHDLIALALGATRDAAVHAASRGLRAARLKSIKADSLQHIASPDLDVAAVAKRERITPRYVHLLFEEEGITFSQFLRKARLELAHRMLRDPRHIARNVSAIAYAVGFADLSHFNHSFRRHFGATPTEVRRTSRADTV